MNKVEKIMNSTVSTIKDNLKSKGIKYQAKSKKSDLQALIASNAKSLAMGNRTGSFYFGTRKGTHAGNVARLIAMREVTSKSDIRKKYTSKYSFKQTLERLASEGIIDFQDKAHNSFELTEKGNFLADKLVSIYG